MALYCRPWLGPSSGHSSAQIVEVSIRVNYCYNQRASKNRPYPAEKRVYIPQGLIPSIFARNIGQRDYGGVRAPAHEITDRQ
jgi:hypothetical protein